MSGCLSHCCAHLAHPWAQFGSVLPPIRIPHKISAFCAKILARPEKLFGLTVEQRTGRAIGLSAVVPRTGSGSHKANQISRRPNLKLSIGRLAAAATLALIVASFLLLGGASVEAEANGAKAPTNAAAGAYCAQEGGLVEQRTPWYGTNGSDPLHLAGAE